MLLLILLVMICLYRHAHKLHGYALSSTVGCEMPLYSQICEAHIIASNTYSCSDIPTYYKVIIQPDVSIFEKRFQIYIDT